MEFTDFGIATHWGIEIKELNIISERVILLTTNDDKKFILKKKGNTEQIKNEIELLKHIQSNNLKVHFPLVNNYGEFIFNYKNDNYCIYNYIVGQTFSATECVQNPIVPHLFGETIASLHKMMNNEKIASNFSRKDLYNTVYGWAVNKVLNVYANQQLKDIFKNLEEELKAIIEGLPKQLIHRDAHISNIIYKDCQLAGVIDFEIVEVNVRIFDPCYCSTSILSEIFSDETLRDNWFDFVGILFAEYNKINDLKEVEAKSIWHIMLSIQTIFMAYFASNPKIFEINKAMFMWIYENKTKIENKLTLK
ncbi:phosphotransferase enzyme family protein [Halalkalibacter urbisdiaboli]|uniref:phosphotransferase enzyme family protein n=1 Tax=Halalkalibacter urbisdiaboli TaxID=1960589 RepID=UPI000B437714|nr:phosphotransferase [Halalkalibacter urbisdiaboli]